MIGGAAGLDIVMRGGGQHHLVPAHSLAACRLHFHQSSDALASMSGIDQITSWPELLRPELHLGKSRMSTRGGEDQCPRSGRRGGGTGGWEENLPGKPGPCARSS